MEISHHYCEKLRFSPNFDVRMLQSPSVRTSDRLIFSNFCAFATIGPPSFPLPETRGLGPLRSTPPVFRFIMASIGTPLSPSATRIAFLGSGELGKEVVIELQRLGCEVIAIDRYANAPAMQVAHRSYVINMLDGAALRTVLEQER